jgi:hypothetical protein
MGSESGLSEGAWCSKLNTNPRLWFIYCKIPYLAVRKAIYDLRSHVQDPVVSSPLNSIAMEGAPASASQDGMNRCQRWVLLTEILLPF